MDENAKGAECIKRDCKHEVLFVYRKEIKNLSRTGIVCIADSLDRFSIFRPFSPGRCIFVRFGPLFHVIRVLISGSKNIPGGLFLVQLVLSDQLIILFRIQKLIKGIRHDFIFFIAFDILKIRSSVHILHIAV